MHGSKIPRFMTCLILASALELLAAAAHAETIWLSTLDFSKSKVTDKIRPAIDKTINGNPLTINKQVYPRGVCG